MTNNSILQKPAIQLTLLILLGLIVLLPGTGTLPLLDRDEPRFAGATVEMMERSDWIIPYFNDEYRFDKPVLTYWLMRASYTLLGINELGARLHSIISAILTAMLLWWVGRRWFSPIVGMAAAGGFLTCFQVVLNGRSCVADMPMVLAVAISQAAMFELISREKPERRNVWNLVFWIALGLGFLAKGPIALIVPALTVLIFRFVFWRKPLYFNNLRFLPGIPLLLAIVAAWGIPALVRTHGLFWDVGMNQHVVKRGLDVLNGRIYFPLFYILTAFLSLFPWIAFAGRGWAVVRNNRSMENAFLLSWLISPYIIFTFYATQLPHYVMPGFAAFFLILAQAIECPFERRPWMQWWFRSVVGLFFLITATLLAVLLILPFAPPYDKLQTCLWGLVGLLVALIVLALAADRKSIIGLTIAIILIGLGISTLAGGLRRLSPAVQMVPIFKSMPEESQYLGFHFMEGTLVFYSSAKWEETNNIEKVRKFMSQPGPRLVVMLVKEIPLDGYFKWQWLGKEDQLYKNDYSQQVTLLDTSGYEVEEVRGLNMGRSTWVDLLVYRKTVPLSPNQTISAPDMALPGK